MTRESTPESAARSGMVGVVMGSDSDLEVMSGAVALLQQFAVPHEVRVISAHRTPDAMVEYGRSARSRGMSVIIAGAGGAAHLPGMLAAVTSVPVVGVPVQLARLDGLDSLLSIVQMPRGVPVGTMAINGAANAALFAVRILAITDDRLDAALVDFAAAQANAASTADQRVRDTHSAS